VRARVVAARALQLARAGKPNAHLLPAELSTHCRLADADQKMLESAVEKLQLSARSMHRILRVARTLADMAKHGIDRRRARDGGNRVPAAGSRWRCLALADQLSTRTRASSRRGSPIITRLAPSAEG